MIQGQTRPAVLCDFDGTISAENVGDQIYRRFAGCGLAYAEQWERGEISSEQELRSSFATIRASRAEMEQFLLDSIDIDQGVRHLVSFCRGAGIRFAVVSDGLGWYIRLLLQAVGLEGVDVYSAEIEFLEDGFEFRFPWYGQDTPLGSVSKPKIIQEHQRAGSTVAYIGNGMNDRHAVGVADLVFAKDDLLEFCRDQSLHVIPFESLTQVSQTLFDLNESGLL